MCLQSSNNKIPESIHLVASFLFYLLLIKATKITEVSTSQSPLCMSSIVPQSPWCAFLWLSFGCLKYLTKQQSHLTYTV